MKLPRNIMERRDLTQTAKMVYVDLADRMGANGVAWPGVRRLAQDAGVDRKAIMEAIALLEQAGLISVERAGLGQRNRYRLQSGPESGPVVVRKADHNQTKGIDPSNQTNKKTSVAAKKDKYDPWAEACKAMTTGVLETDTFRAAWADWVAYRQHRRQRLTPETVKRQIRKLEKWGHDKAVASLEQSIEKGWQGFFESKEDANGLHGRRTEGDPVASAGPPGHSGRATQADRNRADKRAREEWPGERIEIPIIDVAAWAKSRPGGGGEGAPP